VRDRDRTHGDIIAATDLIPSFEKFVLPPHLVGALIETLFNLFQIRQGE